MQMDSGCRALLINGGGGAGKTTLGQSIGRLLTERRLPTAVVDLDALAQFGPAPADPPIQTGSPVQVGSPVRGGWAARPGFHDRLRLRNLAAVWATYRAAGARFVVVSGTVETAELRRAYSECLAGCDVQMVRLETPLELIEPRTLGTTRGPQWDLRTALESHARLARIEDFTVANDRPLEEVAAEILAAAGWG